MSNNTTYYCVVSPRQFIGLYDRLDNINDDLLRLIRVSYSNMDVADIVQLVDQANNKEFRVTFNQRWDGTWPEHVNLKFMVLSTPLNTTIGHL